MIYWIIGSVIVLAIVFCVSAAICAAKCGQILSDEYEPKRRMK